MSHHLFEERWMPVLMRDGSRSRISPAELGKEDVVAFDAERGDFNAALAQFAIGLLQTATPVDTDVEWRRRLTNPPDQATLRVWFEPFAKAFQLDGDGIRFMQDHDLREQGGDAVGIGALFIESPGENAVKNNSDHFIKRGQIRQLCPDCASLALFTLQVNAPAGGAGIRTSLRGGGPLTTLLVADTRGDSGRSLWHSLWLNVRRKAAFDDGQTACEAPLHLIFPWCASQTAIQKDGGQTTPAQTHPAHVFWAMPRRIRLDMVDTTAGRCDVCAREHGGLVKQYVTRPQGFNYKGPWRHPLSPYYETKEGWLPMHPQPDGLGYRHWLGWVLGMQNDKRKVERAPAIDHFFAGRAEDRLGFELRLWAFGFDMDNMKARCWYEATVPIHSLADCSPAAQRALREEVGRWLAGAELAASYLRGAVRDAWFGSKPSGDFTFVDALFWSRTEPGFYALLRRRIEAGARGEAGDVAASEAWLKELGTTALRIFDEELVGTGPIERMKPARVAAAHEQLRRNLFGTKLRTALGLPLPLRAAKPQKPLKKQSAASAA